MSYTFLKIILWMGYLGLPFALLGNSLVVLSLGFPILCVCGLFGLALFTRSRSIDGGILFLGFGFAILPILTSFFAIDPGASLIRAISGLIGYLIFLYLISLSERKKNLLDDCLYIVTGSGVMLSLYYILNFSLQSVQSGFARVISERSVGGLASLPWGASNVISAVLFFSLATALYLVDKSKKLGLSHFALTIILFGICLTLSRTGIVLSFMLFAFYFAQNNLFSKLPVLLVIGVLLSGSIYYWSINDPNSFESVFTDRVEVEGGNGRLDIWAEKLDFFTANYNNPIGYYSSLYIFDGVSAHNFFITTLIEQSFVGLLSLSFLFYPFFRAKAFLSNDRMLLVGLFLGLVNLFFEDANSNQQYIFILWLYMAIIYIVIQRQNIYRVKTKVLSGVTS
jgi:hypothetical protein